MESAYNEARRRSVESATLGERQRAARSIMFLHMMFSDHPDMGSWIAELNEDNPHLAQAVRKLAGK